MLTIEEIQHATTNLTDAREALLHADRRLADILDTKKAFEQKAFTRLGACMTIALALLACAGTIYKDHGATPIVLGVVGVALVFFMAAALFSCALLLDEGYGSLASARPNWPWGDNIDGESSDWALTLADMTDHLERRIAVSIRANNKKAAFIRYGVYCAIAGATAPGVAMLLR